MKPLYLEVKHHILEGIAEKRWPPGAMVPSENELVVLCKVSRMTARRALEELTADGTLRRVRGKGTFVNEIRHRSSLIEIRNIADEIRQRDNIHHCEPLVVNQVPASEELATAFQCQMGDSLFHTSLLHRENGVAIQLEDRFVSPELAPEYLEQDFETITPHEYLSMIAPISEAEHLIEAIPCDDHLCNILEIGHNDACLLLRRTTWCKGRVVSHALLYHPGSRYQLGSRFTPN